VSQSAAGSEGHPAAAVARTVSTDRSRDGSTVVPVEDARDDAGDLLRGTTGPLVAEHDVILLDLDGVIYLGRSPVAGAARALDDLRAGGTRIAFVTNNAARAPDAVARHLAELGVAAEPDEIVTSAQAAARVIADRFAARGGGRPRVLAVGGEGLRQALERVGCALVSSADERPDVVAQGFSPDLAYADLAEAALAVRAGAWWIATNRDRTLPTDRGIQPGNGALVGAVEAAVGHPPAAFAGKPDAALLEEAVRRTGARRALMVGDRLDTDIEGARRVGLASLCVLTGISSGADLVAAPRAQRPQHIGASVAALLVAQPAVADLGGGRWRCGAWVARADDGAVDVAIGDGADDDRKSGGDDGPADAAAAAGSRDVRGRDASGATGDDAVDLLRAVCAAAWSAFDGAPPGGVRLPRSAEPLAAAVRLDGLLSAHRPAVG
jgi:glycerol-1-phosphatase